MAAVSVMLVHALVASHQWLNHHIGQTTLLIRTYLYDDFSPSQLKVQTLFPSDFVC
jgi:hypothetical protein